MSRVHFTHDANHLKGKTVVITGGASGIGEGFVRLASQDGANVIFGDLNVDLGARVAKETGATFVPTNVTVYEEQLQLFRTAREKHGGIDHAVANAGIYEPQQWFDPSLDLESVQEEPSTAVYDVNLRGVTIFSHLASVFLRQGGASSSDSKSLTIISSVAGVHNPPDTPLYGTTKAGLIGLGRSLAQKLPKEHGVRVNVICPSITSTPLAAAMKAVAVFESAGVPIQTSTDVANTIAGVIGDHNMNGATLYVIAGDAYDIEAGLQRTMPDWLGPEIVEMMKKVRSEAVKMRGAAKKS